jgi:hypothetical protein
MTESRSHGLSRSGVELTDAELQRRADQAEAGYDVAKLHRRPGRPSMGSGPATVFPVRLDPELRRALDARAIADQATASAVVREALRRYLHAS